jgi:hypothetical protein
MRKHFIYQMWLPHHGIAWLTPVSRRVMLLESGALALLGRCVRNFPSLILIDGGDAAWRLDYVKTKLPKLEMISFTDLLRGKSVTSRVKELVTGGLDVALQCAAGEYAKGWTHYFEQMLGMETDTSELLN